MTSNEKRSIYMQGLDAQEFIDYIWTECKGVESFLIGSSVELAFKSVCSLHGWRSSKIGDLDTSKRYDFECIKDLKTYTFEIKTLSANRTVGVGYKDSRKVKLPSGYEWITKARHVSERFDYFVVSLVNYTNNNLDLVAIPFENLPKLRVKNKKDHIFRPEERDWISENYVSTSINLKSIDPLDKRFIKLGNLLNNL